MALSERERRRRRFEALLVDNSMTSATAATLLHSSISRISSWRKTESAAGSNPVLAWAIELLEFKIAAMVAPAKKARTS